MTYVIHLLLVSILVFCDILHASRSASKAMNYYLDMACESIFKEELSLDAQQLKTSRDMSDEINPAVSFSAVVSND